jgi:hypothetical protein
MHFEPTGQHTIWPAEFTQTCASGQHTPSTQRSPSLQHTPSPAASKQKRSCGQQMPLMHGTPSGQQVGGTAGSPKQRRLFGQQCPSTQRSSGLQQTPLHINAGGHGTHPFGVHTVSGGQHVWTTAPPAKYVQQPVSGGQQNGKPSGPTQHFQSGSQHRVGKLGDPTQQCSGAGQSEHGS